MVARWGRVPRLRRPRPPGIEIPGYRRPSHPGLPRKPIRESLARRAEFIQPGVSTPGGESAEDPQAPQDRQILPREAPPGYVGPPGLPGRGGGPGPGVDTPGWV